MYDNGIAKRPSPIIPIIALTVLVWVILSDAPKPPVTHVATPTEIEATLVPVATPEEIYYELTHHQN